MPAPNDFYTGGTITVTNGSTAVTGSLTGWLNQAKAGDELQVTTFGDVKIAADATGNTSLTLVKPWPNATTTTTDYRIYHRSTQWNTVSTFSTKFADFIDNLAPSASIDATNADNIGSGTLSPSRIGANALTNANLAQMPANTFKGNNTGAPANALDLTTAQMKAALSIPAIPATTVVGNIPVWGDTTGTTLLAGSKPLGTELSIRQNPMFSSDFMNVASPNGPFLITPISSGQALMFGSQYATVQGLILLQSSATANSGVLVSTPQNILIFGGGERYDAVAFWYGTATATTRIAYFDTATSAEPTDGVYFEITGSGAIYGKSAYNGSRSTTSAIIASATAGYYHFRVTINAAATLATFEVFNTLGTLLGSQTLSTNIPNVVGRDFGAGIIATNSAAAAANLIAIDYIGFGVPGRTIQRGATT